MTCDTMQLSVRNVDEDVYREFKAKAQEQGMTIGQAIVLAMEKWVDEEMKKRDITELEPTQWGDEGDRTSERVDEILYGG